MNKQEIKEMISEGFKNERQIFIEMSLVSIFLLKLIHIATKGIVVNVLSGILATYLIWNCFRKN